MSVNSNSKLNKPRPSFNLKCQDDGEQRIIQTATDRGMRNLIIEFYSLLVVEALYEHGD